MKVRHAHTNDIIAIQEVARHTWHDTYEDIFEEAFINEFIDKAYSEDHLQKSIETTDFYVAEEQDEVIGFLQFVNKKNGEYELSRVYLLPAYHRLGFGSLLLEDAIHETRPKVVILDVEKENEGAIGFYLSKGFYVADEYEEEFLGQTVQTVKMRKEF